MSLVTGRHVKGLHKLGACFQLLARIISLNLQRSQLTGEFTHLLRSDTLSDDSLRAGCAAFVSACLACGSLFATCHASKKPDSVLNDVDVEVHGNTLSENNQEWARSGCAVCV